MEKKSENKRRVRLLGLKKFQETDRAKKARQAAKNKSGGKLKKSLLNVENEKKLRKNIPVNIKPLQTTRVNLLSQSLRGKELKRHHQEESCVSSFQMNFLLLQIRQGRRRYTNAV